MNTTRHPADFPYTRAELDALFHYARAHDVEKAIGKETCKIPAEFPEAFDIMSFILPYRVLHQTH